MRIISEDGLRDVPYELVALYIDGEQLAAMLPSGDCAFQLSHPETPRQAQHAIDRITEAYQSGAKVVWMDRIMEEVRDE